LLENNISPRVLLIEGKSQYRNSIAPPISLYKYRHYLQQRNIACELLIGSVDNIESALAKCRGGEYDIIGFNFSPHSLLNDLNLLWRFRHATATLKKSPLFISVDQQVAANSEQCLQMGIDVVFLGHAEKTLCDFCQRYRANRFYLAPAAIEDLVGDMAGLVFTDSNGEMIYREANGLTQAYFEETYYQQLFSMNVPYNDYWKASAKELSDSGLEAENVYKIVNIDSAVPSSHRSSANNSRSVLPLAPAYQSNIFYLNADQISDLLLFYIDYYKAKAFNFSDDSFFLDHKFGVQRVEQLCDLILEHKACGRIHSSVHFSCQARVADFLLPKINGKQNVNVSLLNIMASAGFNSIALNLETFSERPPRATNAEKAAINSQTCFDLLECMLKIGIIPQINFVLGVPGASVGDILDTLRFAMYYLTQGCDLTFSAAVPALPGSPQRQASRTRIDYLQWLHPTTQENFHIENYVVPEDPSLAYLSANFDDAYQHQLRVLAENYIWQDRSLYKRAKNIQALVVAAKLVGDVDLSEQFETIFEALMQKRLAPSLGDTFIHRQRIDVVKTASSYLNEAFPNSA